MKTSIFTFAGVVTISRICATASGGDARVVQAFVHLHRAKDFAASSLCAMGGQAAGVHGSAFVGALRRVVGQAMRWPAVAAVVRLAFRAAGARAAGGQ